MDEIVHYRYSDVCISLCEFHSICIMSIRPVPLQHFVFPSGAEGLYLVVDHEGNFREENFQRAMLALQVQ